MHALASQPEIPAPYVRYPKQEEAALMMNQTPHTLLYGGSGSGKTFAVLVQIINRALQKTSKHLIIRHTLVSVVDSVVEMTMPDVLRICFPQLRPHINYRVQRGIYEIPNLEGGISQIWLAGSDSNERMEKILGTHFSTIFCEEVSQMHYSAISLLNTRLRENSGLRPRFFYACNPCSRKHWAAKLFLDDQLPTGEPWTRGHASLLMNPHDNPSNSQSYLEELGALSKRQRDRFLLGKWQADVEGALWSEQDIINAKCKIPGDIVRTVVAVDPAVSNTSGSDECGIVVASLDDNDDGVVEADYSGKMSTRAWAARVVLAYDEYDANEIVIETNQGGDLCVDAIKNVPGGKHLKIVKVHASRGKQARAEPVQALYELGKISHLEGLEELETELAEWAPVGTKASPNRLDAVTHGLTHLMLKNTRKRVHIGRRR